jgi:hypothetical protein
MNANIDTNTVNKTTRDLKLFINSMGSICAEFNSNGSRKKRLLTPAEVEQAKKAIGDDLLEDIICSRIV